MKVLVVEDRNLREALDRLGGVEGGEPEIEAYQREVVAPADDLVIEAAAKVLAQDDPTPAWASPTPDAYRARARRVLEALGKAGYDVIRPGVYLRI